MLKGPGTNGMDVADEVTEAPDAPVDSAADERRTEPPAAA